MKYCLLKAFRCFNVNIAEVLWTYTSQTFTQNGKFRNS